MFLKCFSGLFLLLVFPPCHFLSILPFFHWSSSTFIFFTFDIHPRFYLFKEMFCVWMKERKERERRKEQKKEREGGREKGSVRKRKVKKEKEGRGKSSILTPSTVLRKVGIGEKWLINQFRHLLWSTDIGMVSMTNPTYPFSSNIPVKKKLNIFYHMTCIIVWISLSSF